jgi:hypothetical protein
MRTQTRLFDPFRRPFRFGILLSGCLLLITAQADSRISGTGQKCEDGEPPEIIYQYGFEAGPAGWTTPAGAGTNTWAIVSTNPHSGSFHYRGEGTNVVSDQRLVSPAMVLPLGLNPLILQFRHVPNLENNGITNCYDGGILEVTNNAGSTWTQVPDVDFLSGGYTGTISSSFGNPLGGRLAWCSAATSTYRLSIADIRAYAGQTVQFRWRIGTDNSTSRPGWDLDDVRVQGCLPGPVIFQNRFEG